MDREQVKFLLTVLGVIIWVGGAIYERYKKNMARRRPNVTHSRPASVARSAPKPVRDSSSAPRMKPENRTSMAPKGLSISFDDEGRSYFAPTTDENFAPQPDDAMAADKAAECPHIEDLRRAVIWSEILRRKF